MEVSGQLHAISTLLPRKELPITIVKKARRNQIPSSCFGEEKNLLPVPGLEVHPHSLQPNYFTCLIIPALEVLSCVS
jgi:hypothetical protein